MADNVIQVNVTSNKTHRVSVSPGQVQNEITATPDISQYYSNLSKNWAIGEGLIQNEDYSSKYYAKQSKNNALIADSFQTSAKETYNSLVQLANTTYIEIDVAKNSAIQNIEFKAQDAETAVEASKENILNSITTISEQEKQEIKDFANLIKENAAEIANRTSFSMFDTITKDHILTYEETKGLALQGTYVYKEAIAGSRYGYPDFYNKVVEEFNEATSTETVNGVTVKVHSNGHKFYDIADKTGIDGFFDSYGSAWFYGVDTENERVFLPRNNWFEQATGDISEVGQGIEAGLPYSRIYTETAGLNDYYGNENGNTQYNVSGTSSGNGAILRAAGSQSNFDGLYIQDNNGTYGKSNTVQPPAVKKLLYICVGNTTSYEGMTEVVNQGMEILEQVNQGIESRVDVDVTNLTDTGKENVIGLLLPDYTTEVIRSSSGFTSETNQWLKWESYQTGSQTIPRVIINGVDFVRYTSGNASIGVGGTDILPISKGDVITTTGSVSLKTYSMKGAK